MGECGFTQRGLDRMRLKINTYVGGGENCWEFKYTQINAGIAEASIISYQLCLNVYLSFRSCDSCRRLSEPRHHSLLFNHWSVSKCLVFMAVRTPSIHVFLGRPLFLLSPGNHSIINFGSLSSCIRLTWPYQRKKKVILIDKLLGEDP